VTSVEERRQPATGIGASVKRVEDVRLLTGSGEYLADSAPSDAKHLAILRSTVAHGRIAKIDGSRARELPG